MALRIEEYGFTSAEFSPDGRTLAAMSRDGTVRVWESPRGTQRFKVAGVGRGSLAIRFPPGGEVPVPWAADNVLLTWDIEFGERAH